MHAVLNELKGNTPKSVTVAQLMITEGTQYICTHTHCKKTALHRKVSKLLQKPERSSVLTFDRITAARTIFQASSNFREEQAFRAHFTILPFYEYS